MTSPLLMNVAEFLLAGKTLDSTALSTSAGEHTYRDLLRATRTVAAYLLQLHAAKGDRALLVCDNSLFWVAAYLGTLRAGLVCVPLPPAASAEELDYILDTTEAKFVFADSGCAARNSHRLRCRHVLTDRAVRPIAQVLSQQSFAGLGTGAGDASPLLPSSGGHDLAALMFTSGSTGRPRGVMVSHTNIIANTESILSYLRLTAADRIMTVLPFHYCFGASLLHTHLRVGGSLVLDSRFTYPEVILQRMIETQCTGFAGVPSHFQILLRRSGIREKRFPHLRYIQQAGGHLAPGLVRELCDALPQTKVYVMYGQTEATARLSCLPPEFLEKKSGSVGKGIPGVLLSVLDESGELVKPGDVGEIVAEGMNITQGYWRAPMETEGTFRNGRLHTGDLATVDADGFIYIAGRSKDFLKCGGKRVSCRQLEEQVLGFDGVMEAAVVAMPDEILGDAVRLFVVPRDLQSGEIEARLRCCCKERMPPQLVPREIVVLQALPKNSAGKVLKEQLKSWRPQVRCFAPSEPTSMPT